jgi:hypothetical protein
MALLLPRGVRPFALILLPRALPVSSARRSACGTVCVQALVAQPPVEAFDVQVLHRHAPGWMSTSAIFRYSAQPSTHRE